MDTKKTKAKSTSSLKNVQDTLDKVMKDFTSSWDYCTGSWHGRWIDNYALYNNNRVKVGYNGITDTFVPMTFSTIETMVSALFGSKPKFDFVPPGSKPDQKTDILNSLLDYYWDKDQWNIKVISWGRTMLMLGTSVVYLWWDMDHPCMINVPLRDFFIDPMASTLENARYMGRRFLTTTDELKSFEVVDPDTGEMIKKYKNLDKIESNNQMGQTGEDAGGVTGGATGDLTDKQEKDMFYGSTIEQPEQDQVEIIEYWTEDRCISIANRGTVIEDTENYYKAKGKAAGNSYAKGIMPFAALRDYIDESLFYAKGEVDIIADEQELLNDITNQTIDSITFNLNQMYTLDPKHADLLEEIENVPGAVYLAEQNTLVPIPVRPIPANAFEERQNIKNEMRETTASNEVVKGTSTDSNVTATEINAQVAGAGQRIKLKVVQIENEGFHRLANVIFQMVQLYVTEPMVIQITGKSAQQWALFDPNEFEGDYQPRVQLDIEVQQKKQQDAKNSQEMLAAFMGDPTINQVELKKMVLQKGFNLDPDEAEKLMAPPPPPMGAPGAIDPATGMPVDPMAAGAPGAPVPGAPVPGGPPGMPPQLPPMPPEQPGGIPPEVVQALQEGMAQGHLK